MGNRTMPPSRSAGPTPPAANSSSVPHVKSASRAKARRSEFSQMNLLASVSNLAHLLLTTNLAVVHGFVSGVAPADVPLPVSQAGRWSGCTGLIARY